MWKRNSPNFREVRLYLPSLSNSEFFIRACGTKSVPEYCLTSPFLLVNNHRLALLTARTMNRTMFQMQQQLQLFELNQRPISRSLPKYERYYEHLDYMSKKNLEEGSGIVGSFGIQSKETKEEQDSEEEQPENKEIHEDIDNELEMRIRMLTLIDQVTAEALFKVEQMQHGEKIQEEEEAAIR